MTQVENRSLSAYRARLQEIEIKRAELEGLMEVRENARRQRG
ncbi:hypothetical protein [Kribbella pittospori]|nr:hypothetical protein [Kribbella pittospori]